MSKALSFADVVQRASAAKGDRDAQSTPCQSKKCKSLGHLATLRCELVRCCPACCVCLRCNLRVTAFRNQERMYERSETSRAGLAKASSASSSSATAAPAAVSAAVASVSAPGSSAISSDGGVFILTEQVTAAGVAANWDLGGLHVLNTKPGEDAAVYVTPGLDIRFDDNFRQPLAGMTFPANGKLQPSVSTPLNDAFRFLNP